MDWVMIGKLVGILLLVAGNAFFVGSEIALTSARRSRIKQLAGTGNKSAKIVQLLHNEPERFYSVTQIGITLVSLALGAIGMVTLTQIFDPGIVTAFTGVFGDSQKVVGWAHTFSYVIAFIIISFMHVVAGELAPKVLAFHKAEAMSLSVAWTINFMHATMRPLIWVMNHSSNGLLWLFGQRDLAGHGEGHFSMTGEEIRTILSASEQEGALDPQLTMMLRGVFDLDDHTARDAMVPRPEVKALAKSALVSDALNLYRQERRERYPVYDTTIDHIVGVVAMKQLLNTLAESENPMKVEKIAALQVSEIMLPPYFIPDTMNLSNLLKDFTSNRRQMAIVLDEYGGTAGLITLEDLLEEIVGDYEDEFTPRHRHIKKEDKYQYSIDGGVRVTELEPKLNFPFPTGDYVTLGGLINHRLGRIAVVGDTVQLEGARLEVLEMDEHRISRVLFEDQSVEEEGDGAENEGRKEAPTDAASSSAKENSKEKPAAQSVQDIPNQKADQKSGPNTGAEAVKGKAKADSDVG